MPFTFSIINGVGAGFVAYSFMKLVNGKGGTVHPMMYVVSAAFIVYFSLAVLRSLFGI
jgi:AGZA family xanthine/uracil permease-like MFS transporter